MTETAEGGSPPSPPGDGRTDAPRPEGEATSWVRRGLVIAATVAIGAYVSLPTLVVIAALIFMIFMHELGHYLTAKAAGMKVTEFFIGFGPRLWSFRRGETEYGFKAIPAGAYVRIIGMSNLEEIDPAEEDRTYRQKSYRQRMSVALAGSTMHFLMAIALAFTVLSVVGTPDVDSARWSVGAVGEDTAAAAAGLEVGDRVLAVDGQRFESFQALSAYLREHPGDKVTLLVDRDGQELRLQTTLGTRTDGGEEIGFLGVAAEFPSRRVGPVTGLVDSAKLTGQTMWLSIEGLKAFFSPAGVSGYVDTLTGSAPAAAPGEIEGENRLLSPVGAVRIASDAASTSLVAVLQFMFAINVFVGVFNLVPLLPFDGGHVAIATYERIRSRKGRRYFADVGKLMPLTYAVVALLILVGLTALYLDLVDPISLR
ncbi:MAG TPA: M50 family metallopeptidase [Acidimicrobiales bacterium]|nr:M50 family metallopeptidase [Acidimicrobiales bacterium]